MQTQNPGAYLKLGFTGTRVAVNLDMSALTLAGTPDSQYPVVRFSVDAGRPQTIQLTSKTDSIMCAKGLPPGSHTLLLEYVAGYVFLDFWTPINVLRVTGFTLDDGSSLVKPTGFVAQRHLNALFLGDSITNGDDDVATFSGGITNTVDTQDATIAYPSVVAAGIDAEFGVVAYGGASWDHTAADGHTPGLMTSYSMLDSLHSRLVAGKLAPRPDDIFVNMGENSGPTGDDVPKLLASLRVAGNAKTNIFIIVPFSGRARAALKSGYERYRKTHPSDSHAFFIDLGDSPLLSAAGPTTLSVDGQHPLAYLHAMLGARLVQARSEALQGLSKHHRP
jgi:hypothetical protein